MLRIITILISFLFLTGFDYVKYLPDAQTGDCSAHSYTLGSHPGAWGTYVDEDFGTTVRYFGASGSTLQYTTFPITDYSGNSVALASGITIYRTDGSYVGAWGSETACAGDSNPTDYDQRWSYNTADLLYYHCGTKFYSLDVSGAVGTWGRTEIKDWSSVYPTLSHFGAHDEGSFSSWDSRYWAFSVTVSGTSGVKYITVWDRVNDSYAHFDINAYAIANWDVGHQTVAINWVAISPSGDYVVVLLSENTSPWNIVLDVTKDGNGEPTAVTFNRDFFNTWQIGHAAVGYSMEGDEIVVYDKNAGLSGIGVVNLTQGVESDFFAFHPDDDCPPETGEVNNIGHGHIAPMISSDAAKRGWFSWTTFLDSNGDTTQDFWLYNEVWAMRVSSTASDVIIYRIAHIRTDYTSYSDDGKQQWSMDGSEIYWVANWDGTETRAIYRAELPTEWWLEIAGISPSPANSIQGVSISELKITENLTAWNRTDGLR